MVVYQISPHATSTAARPGMPHDINKRPVRGQPAAQPPLPSLAKKAPYKPARLAGSPAPSPDVGRKPASTTRTPVSAPRRETPSPVKSGLNSNVTPRSGPRRIRTQSTSTTPNGTPSGTPKASRPVSMIVGKEASVERPTAATGIGIQGVSLHTTSRSGSVVGGVSSPSSHIRNASPERQQLRQEVSAQSPMFFHASDASAAATAAPKAPVLKSKSSAFFYANGEIEVQQSVGTQSNAISPIQGPSKFFHANGTPEADSVPSNPRHTPSSSLSRPSPKITTLASAGRTMSGRSASPLKETETVRQQNLHPTPRHAPMASNASSRSRPDSGEAPFNSRRGSVQSFVSAGYHQKSQSIQSLEQPNITRAGYGTDSNGRISDASSSFISEPESLEPIPAQMDYVSFQPMSPTSPLASPSHSAFSPLPTGDGTQQTKLSQAQEMAAQARRERKVLDLEISNSSLLAINRTLEREMRKQKAELRRYRRMTSSGRFSLISASDGRPSMTNTDTSQLSPIDGSDEEGYGLSDEEEEDDDDDLSSLSSDSTSSSNAPGVDSEAAARRRAKDAKRLRLDLERHRSILADSQALNQSLKRCLTRTEALISEGKRALDHKVRVSEVHVGGRVLDADEAAETVELDEGRRGLLSPSLDGEDGFKWHEQQQPADTVATAKEPLASPLSPPFEGVTPFVRDEYLSSPEKSPTSPFFPDDLESTPTATPARNTRLRPGLMTMPPF